MLCKFKREKSWSPWVDWLGYEKIRWLISQTIGSLWSVQGGEWFKDRLKEWEKRSVWPKRRRENEDILLLERLRLWNQASGRMDGDIFLYHVVEWGGSDPQCLRHRLDVRDLNMGIKSDNGICALGEHLRDAEELANLSANSLPVIPVWPGTQRNWISVPDLVKQYKMRQIMIMRG